MNYKLTAFIFLLLLSGITFAQFLTVSDYSKYVVYSCSANETLVKNLTLVRTVNGVQQIIHADSVETCQFGCDAGQIPNKCKESVRQTDFSFFILLIGVVIITILFLRWVFSRR